MVYIIYIFDLLFNIIYYNGFTNGHLHTLTLKENAAGPGHEKSRQAVMELCLVVDAGERGRFTCRAPMGVVGRYVEEKRSEESVWHVCVLCTVWRVLCGACCVVRAVVHVAIDAS